MNESRTMRALSSFPVDDDIVDAILTRLDDVHSLQSMVCVCKAVYAVFRRHPNSIVRAVAYSAVGPALPQALCLIRIQSVGGHAIEEDEEDNEDYVSVPIPQEVQGDNAVITPREAARLIENARTIWQLEDVFSQSCKDRTSSVSALSEAESLRFQRAVYRLWAYRTAFDGLEGPEGPDSDDDGNDSEDEERTQELAKRVDYLDRFPTIEIIELVRVFNFLESAMRAIRGALGLFAPDTHFANSAGPAPLPGNIVAFYTTGESSDEEVPDGECMWMPYFTLMRKRGVPFASTAERQLPERLLDSINGAHDTCAKCGAEKGLSLFNQTNWSRLRYSLTADEVKNLFPGRLKDNYWEMQDFWMSMRSWRFSFTQMMEEMSKGLADPDEEAGWSNSDWLCLDCVKDFIRRHILEWWRERKRHEGHTIKEDCWWGYDCRTQTHRSQHAVKLNHLCKPTRSNT